MKLVERINKVKALGNLIFLDKNLSCLTHRLPGCQIISEITTEKKWLIDRINARYIKGGGGKRTTGEII